MSSSSFTFKNGDKIPVLAFGAAPIDESYLVPEFLEGVLKSAIQNGYRHFDEGEVYGTETVLGNALAAFPEIPRSDFFITSKVHPWMGVKEKDIEGALRRSLAALRLDYVDLYLIHTPFLEVGGLTLEETWAAMETIKTKGLARHIGVSNFRSNTLERLLKFAKEKPEVNQIELNPYHFERDTVEFGRRHNILTEGYGPLTPVGRSADGPLVPILNSMATKYGVTPGQVLLKWLIQQGFVAIMTTSKDERQKAHRKLDFTLEGSDIRLITEEGAKWPKQLCRWGMGTPRVGEKLKYEELIENCV